MIPGPGKTDGNSESSSLQDATSPGKDANISPGNAMTQPNTTKLPRPREAVRALMLDQHGRILLIRTIEPKSQAVFWLAPGGGIEKGEEREECLQREIFEETGLADCTIGPQIWHRSHTFFWDGNWLSQSERFFLVRTSAFSPTDQNLPNAMEQKAFGGFVWWSIPGIIASTEAFVPRLLGQFLEQLQTEGPPPASIDVGR